MVDKVHDVALILIPPCWANPGISHSLNQKIAIVTFNNVRKLLKSFITHAVYACQVEAWRARGKHDNTFSHHVTAWALRVQN